MVEMGDTSELIKSAELISTIWSQLMSTIWSQPFGHRHMVTTKWSQPFGHSHLVFQAVTKWL